MNSRVSFDLSSVFASVAAAIPDHVVFQWRGRKFGYAETNDRISGVAHYLASAGLGCHHERDELAEHQSGQDHLGIYLRNGNQYLEAMIAGFRSRVAPFNVSYRYVEEELVHLLADAHARALVYNAEFGPRIAAIRDRLPQLDVLIQVADDSGNALLPGAVDYESITTTPPPAQTPTPRGEDLYVLYTGGTTGMPKGVLWKQHDIFLASMGGRSYATGRALASYEELAEQARASAGAMSILMTQPFMHGAAQWSSFTVITLGGRIVIPDNVDRFRPEEALRLAEQEEVICIPLIGDAIARPLVEEIEQGRYDLSKVVSLTNGGAALSPGIRSRLLTALPHAVIMDAVGSSESGMQMNSMATSGGDSAVAMFRPQPDTAVIAEDFSRILTAGEGWLARRDLIPMGYLNDADKTARTFRVVDGARWSIPGDRAVAMADGSIELLGRDSMSINSGGEKIFVEEVERAIAAHPAVYDVLVVGRPSERWGHEVVAVVELARGRTVTDEELIETCGTSLARYKIPKAFIRTDTILRSPAGKADYRWAKAIAVSAVRP